MGKCQSKPDTTTKAQRIIYNTFHDFNESTSVNFTKLEKAISDDLSSQAPTMTILELFIVPTMSVKHDEVRVVNDGFSKYDHKKWMDYLVNKGYKLREDAIKALYAYIGLYDIDDALYNFDVVRKIYTPSYFTGDKRVRYIMDNLGITPPDYVIKKCMLMSVLYNHCDNFTFFASKCNPGDIDTYTTPNNESVKTICNRLGYHNILNAIQKQKQKQYKNPEVEMIKDQYKHIFSERKKKEEENKRSEVELISFDKDD